MVTSSTSLPPSDRPGALLQIMVTPDGRAWVGSRSVTVPPGTDPRVAAADAAAALARREGRDIGAVLVDAGRGERRRMIFTADGRILQSAVAMSDRPGLAGGRRDQAGLNALRPGRDAGRAGDRGEDGGDDRFLMTPPEPPPDIDPASVPAWPRFDIILTDGRHVLVNGTLMAVPRGVADPRAFAVAVAAAQLERMGLARPVRATARDPDGTVWPILIHPGGAATEAGPPEVLGGRSRRGRRRNR